MVKCLLAMQEDPGSTPGLGGSPGEGHGNPLQYACLQNSMDRGALLATVHGVSKSRTQLSNFTSLHFCILAVCGSSLLWRFLTVGGVGRVACQGFLFRESRVSVLVGGAGFLLSGVK